jgi:DNA-binding protein YbaB
MFDALKSMGAVASLLKNKDKIAAAVTQVREELERRQISVDSPDKSVSLLVTASGKVERVTLSPSALAQASGDDAARARLEQTIAGAMNAARARMVVIVQEEISRQAEALGLPELANSPELRKLMGG